MGEPGAIRYLGDEIESLVALGETERAREVLEYLEERGRTLGRRWAVAVAGRCRGLLEAALDHPAEAAAAMERALEAHRDLPNPFELGRTLLAQGGVERRAGNVEAARRALERAHAIFDGLGAALHADAAWAELARV